MGQLFTIPLNGTVSAGSQRVFASNLIGFPFRIKTIYCGFPLGTNRQVQLRFLISKDNDTTTPAGNIPPTGQNILLPFSTTDFLVGDDETKPLHHQVDENSTRNFIKVWATNLDGFDHTVDVVVELEVLPLNPLSAAMEAV